MEPSQVLAAVGPAAAVGLSVFALAQQPWRREAPWTASWRGVLGAIAITGAFLVAAAALGLWRGFWPQNAHERVPLIALGVMSAEIVALLSRRRAVGFAARAAAVGLMLWAIANPYLGGVPLARRAGIWIPGLGAAVLGLWLLVARLAARERGACLPIVLWLTASAASMLLLFGAQFASHSLLAASVAAGLGGLVVCSLWRARVSADGAAGVAVALLISSLLLGYLAQGLPAWMIASNALVPFCVLVRRVPAAARLRPWMGTLACVLTAVALVLPPVIISFRAYMASMEW